MIDQMALLPVATGVRTPDGDTSRARSGLASWELDDHTRHVGMQGLAAARAALQQACARLAA